MLKTKTYFVVAELVRVWPVPQFAKVWRLRLPGYGYAILLALLIGRLVVAEERPTAAEPQLAPPLRDLLKAVEEAKELEQAAGNGCCRSRSATGTPTTELRRRLPHGSAPLTAGCGLLVRNRFAASLADAPA